MKVLVTGATGFIGHRFAERLLADGGALAIEGVRVTGRNAAAAADLERDGAELLAGDVTDPTFVERAVEGMDAVVHCAGRSGLGGPPSLYRANVDGTRGLVDAARAAGVRRFVHIGTPSMYFDTSGALGRDERYRPARWPDAYAESKVLADEIVLGANGSDLETMSLRPRFTTGRGDGNLLPRFIELHRAGKLKRIGRGDNLVDFTAAENLLDAMCLSLTAPAEACGEAYNITNGDPVKLWSFLDRVMEAMGLPPVRASVPYPVAAAAGAVFEGLFAFSSRAPGLSRVSAAVLSHPFTMSIERARARLGYAPRLTNDAMLAEFAGWYRARGPEA